MNQSRIMIRLNALCMMGFQLYSMREISKLWGGTSVMISLSIFLVLMGMSIGPFLKNIIENKFKINTINLAKNFEVIFSILIIFFVSVSMTNFNVGLVFSLFIFGFVLLSFNFSVLEELDKDGASNFFSDHNIGNVYGTLLFGLIIPFLLGIDLALFLVIILRVPIYMYFRKNLDHVDIISDDLRFFPLKLFPLLFVTCLLGIQLIVVEVAFSNLFSTFFAGMRIGWIVIFIIYFLATAIGSQRFKETSIVKPLIFNTSILLFVLYCSYSSLIIYSKESVGTIIVLNAVLFFVFSYNSAIIFNSLIQKCKRDFGGEAFSFSYIFSLETLFSALSIWFILYFTNFRGEKGLIFIGLILSVIMLITVCFIYRLRHRLVFSFILFILLIAPFSIFLTKHPGELVEKMVNRDSSYGVVIDWMPSMHGELILFEDKNQEKTLTSGMHISAADSRNKLQEFQGHLANLLRTTEDRILQIGLGNGEIPFWVDKLDSKIFDLVEIHPEMDKIGKKYFKNFFNDTNYNFIVGDGMTLPLKLGKKYDLIMSDGMFPSSEFASRLYTIDHFKNMKSILSTDGILMTWVPGNLNNKQVKIIENTLTKVFKHSFKISYKIQEDHYENFLIGLNKETDLKEFKMLLLNNAKTILEKKAWPKSVSFTDLNSFIDELLVDQNISKKHSIFSLNTDNRPLLEWYFLTI